MMATTPWSPAGVLRMRNVTDPSHGPAVSNNTVVEVLQADGTWLAVRGLCAATLVVIRNEMVTADLTVELAEFDMTAFPLQIIRPRWWHRLLPSAWKQR